MSMIRGSGGGKGGGGSGSGSVEAPDSLRSKQYARILDLICEGEIGGLVAGMKSIYLDGTPLQNADNSFNFQDVVVDSRVGTQIQGYVAGFNAVESAINVSTEVKAAVSVTRTITDPNVDAVRLTVTIPQLSSQNTSNGNLDGTSVSIAIDVQTAGGGFVEKLADTISGKTMSAYQRGYRVDLPGVGPWDIRVRRVTPDSTSAALANKTIWSTYTTLIDQKLRYPNSALVGISIDAQQFGSIPNRGYDVKLLKVLVPSNYFPETRAYTRNSTTGADTGIEQTWNGSFYVAWTDNPAWCWYDLVTNERYGLGEFIDPATVDKWALYTIGKYCDALVPNGFGGTEPRFTCNIYLQTREEAYRVINGMASIFRGMAFWVGGGMTATHDAPSDPIALFTAANIIDGRFNYSGTDIKARHTVALVGWNDPADGYLQKVEYVEDQEGITRYGVVEAEIAAVGCTSRGQAHRVGRWLLYTERLETEIVTFKTGINGARVYPGAVIKTQDASRAGLRLGGRLLAATTLSVMVDAPVTFVTGKTYTLSVVLPNGNVEDRALSNLPGTTSTLMPGAAFSAAPQAMAIWVVAVSDLSPELWRVIAAKETDGIEVEIVAVEHHPAKYALVESGISFVPAPTTILSTAPPPPTASVTISESLYIKASAVRNKIIISWPAVAGATRYAVEYQMGSGNWVHLGEVRELLVEVDTDPGTYTARVKSLNSLGIQSLAKSSAATYVYGKTAPPPDVEVLLVSRQSDGTRQFTWQLNTPPLDLAGYRLRYKTGTGGVWASMTDLHSGLLLVSPFETNLLAAGTYTFALKAVDTSGNESANAKHIEATLADPRLAGVLAIYGDWVDGFPGTKTSCHRELPSGYLQPNETHATPWVTTWAGTQWIRTPAGSIQYERLFDVGVKTAFTPLVTFVGVGTPTLQMATSDDNVTFSAWVATGSLVNARYVKIRTTVTGAWPIMHDIQTVLSASPVSQDTEDLNTASLTGANRLGIGDVRIPLTKTFAILRKVDVTLQNVGAGWSWELIDKNTTTGPRIKIYNASNVLADAVIDATIRGL